MGRSKGKVISVSIVVGLITAFFLVQLNKSKHGLYPTVSYGNEEDLAARETFEKNRLADPNTGEIPIDIRRKEIAFASSIQKANMAAFKTETWKHLGPNNVTGRARCIAADINNPKILLTGSVSGGLYRSEDGGENWSSVSFKHRVQSVTHIIQDLRPGKNNEWYYCTGEVFGSSTNPGDGIYKSTDNGKTWVALQPEGQPQEFRHLNYSVRLAIDPSRTDSTVLYLASKGAILRSADGGVNWKLILGGDPTENAYYWMTDITVSKTGVHFATLPSGAKGNKKGILRSEDGIHWTEISPDFFPKQYGRIVMDVYEEDEKTVYFLASTTSKGQVSYRYDGTESWDHSMLMKYRYLSGDGSGSGGVWTDLSTSIPVLSKSDNFLFGDFNMQGGYCMDLSVNPNDSNIIAIGGTNLFISTDGFISAKNVSWVGGFVKFKTLEDAMKSTEPFRNCHPDVHEILFLPGEPTQMLVATDGGIYDMKDIEVEESWHQLNNGMQTTQIYAISLNQNPNDEYVLSNVLVGGFQDNSTQYLNLNDKSNKKWGFVAGGDGSGNGVFDYDNYTWIVGAAQSGQIFLTKYNKAAEPLGLGRIDPENARGYLFINPYAHNPFDQKQIYLPAGDVLWSNANITEIELKYGNDQVGINWTRLRKTVIQNGTFTAIAASESQEGLIFLGTNQGEMYRLENMQNPDDLTQTLIGDKKVFDGAGYISSISADPHNANNILICFSNYGRKSIYYSSDKGENWTNVSGNLEENEDGSGNGTAVNVVKIVRGPSGLVYLAGTNSGLYSTTGLPGNATIWNREGANEIGFASIRDIAYRSVDDLLVVGTHGYGALSTHLSQVASQNEIREVSIEIFPNPAQALVRYSVKETPIAIRVTNLQGQAVHSVQQPTASGELDISAYNKGTYIIQFEMKYQTISKQFVVQ